MKRQLIFKIDSKVKKGLCFSSHTGSLLTVYYGRPLVLDLREDDFLSESDLKYFYTSKYARFGLMTTYKEFSEAKNSSFLLEKRKNVPVLKENNNVSNNSEKTSSRKEEILNSLPEKIETLSYKDLRKCCEDLGITVEGRSKNSYEAALKLYMKGE